MPGTTAFPAALDTFPNILSTTLENDTGFEHDVVHNNEAAAIAALQAKVGIDGSAVAGTVDKRLATLEAGGGGSTDTLTIALAAQVYGS